jgi:hypothetical protein
MIDVKQLREEIITVALQKLGLYSDNALELLTLTCAQESRSGTYIKQVEGPALGIFQMEPVTHESLWQSFLSRRTDLAYKVLSSVYLSSKPPVEFLKYNLLYAAMIARCFYAKFNEPLPDANDIPAIADYYKRNWNTDKGSATVEEAIANYYIFIGAGKKNKIK